MIDLMSNYRMFYLVDSLQASFGSHVFVCLRPPIFIS